MKRLISVVTALILAFVAAVPAGAAGRHSGPEELAKGRGSVEIIIQDVVLIPGQVCEVANPAICFFIPNIAVLSTDIFVTQSFDFDARLGPQTSTADTTDGAFGHIKLTQVTSTRTVLRPSGIGGVFCSDPTLVVTPDCPDRTDQTVTETVTTTANVTCLTVIQNRAAIGGHVTKWSGEMAPTRGILLNVTDNTIARQQPERDRFFGTFLTDVPYECPPPGADHPITKGDIYVDQS